MHAAQRRSNHNAQLAMRYMEKTEARIGRSRRGVQGTVMKGNGRKKARGQVSSLVKHGILGLRVGGGAGGLVVTRQTPVGGGLEVCRGPL
jgi:hypothetical protein